VQGSVFIVTKGSGSYKFGLVSIYVLQPEKLKRYLDESEIKLKNEINHLKSDHDGLVGGWEANKNRSQEIRDKIKSLIDGYMNEAVEKILISEQPVTKTDADGVFTLELPKDSKYIVLARAERSVGESHEEYCWMVPVSVTGKQSKVFLSNDNQRTLYPPRVVVDLYEAVNKDVKSAKLKWEHELEVTARQREVAAAQRAVQEQQRQKEEEIRQWQERQQYLASLITKTNVAEFVVGNSRYEQCAISRINPAQIRIEHKGGVACVCLWQLAGDWQKRFGYDPQEAKSFWDTKTTAEAIEQQLIEQRNIERRQQTDPIPTGRVYLQSAPQMAPQADPKVRRMGERP